MSNVIDFKAAREKRSAEENTAPYEAVIRRMDRLELLEEMVRFQEERSRLGHLTLDLMLRGRVLFKALTETAVTHELRLLAGSYMRHLEYEIANYRKANS